MSLSFLVFTVTFGRQSTCTPIDKRSTAVSQGLSPDGIAGVVIGVIGLIFSAVVAFKGWKCWKSRPRQTSSVVAQNQSEELAPISPPAATSITYNLHYHLQPFGQPPISTGQNYGVATAPGDMHSRPSFPAVRLAPVPSSSNMLLQPSSLQPQTIPPPPPPSPTALPGRKLTSRASTWPAGNGEVVTD
ncbi:hypothetical protein K440DRAFT_662403 [Wilcoxina mikolae CBS 423.85]|nr:hypothetical protein K440DRAFT_662403 [Wilcoxina mikolae CBS 423.85]